MPGTLASILVACALLLGAAPSRADVAPGTYTYAITHPTYGDIGSFTNTIRRQGEEVTVDTQLRVAVKIAFVVAHRIEADRREGWRNGRFVSYSSVTSKDDEVIRVEGQAEGDRFVVTGPDGTVEAPADVFPTNPWSIDITNADVVMTTESGRIFPATITGGGEEMVEIRGQQIPARYFAVAADRRHELWYDRNDLLVKFTTVNNGNTITFTLQ